MPSCCSAGRVATAAWVVMALVAACTHAQSIETWCNTKCDEAFVVDSTTLANLNLGCKTACVSAAQSEVDGTPTLSDCHLACLTTHSPSSVDTLDARGGCQAGCALVRELLDAHEIQAVRDELAATAAELRAYTDAEVAALRAETQAALAVLSARATALEVALQAEVADREAGDAALDSKIDEEVTRLVKTINAVKRSINQLERKLSSRLDTLDAEVTEIRGDLDQLTREIEAKFSSVATVRQTTWTTPQATNRPTYSTRAAPASTTSSCKQAAGNGCNCQRDSREELVRDSGGVCRCRCVPN